MVMVWLRHSSVSESSRKEGGSVLTQGNLVTLFKQPLCMSYN